MEIPLHYIVYCDESDSKGKYYSNFYGGALIKASDQQVIERALSEVKADQNINGEIKWTKTAEAYEEKYKVFIDRFFDFIFADQVKMRIMFTQNINHRQNYPSDELNNEYFLLYYQFLKHAFGLRYSNPELDHTIGISVFMDDVPHKDAAFDNFKDYLSSLSVFPIFNRNKIVIEKQNISGVNSKSHNILQAVDVILGAMQFRLNDKHLEKPVGQRIRGKRTRSKERLYKHIHKKICDIRPNFNIGVTTGHKVGLEDRWHDPYRHWIFIPNDSVTDLTKGKRK
jgi:hypothetical protein